MPVIGLGVYKVPKKDTERIVSAALKIGYRLIDTAAFYDNEREVGNAVRKSGVPREEVLVTTKLHPLRIFGAEQAFHASLKALSLDYIDLYLIHWPFLRVRELWETLEKIYSQKLVKAIGVSNFRIKDLEALKPAKVIPMVNQVEFHPFLYRKDLLKYCFSHRIAVEAHSPLTHGKRIKNSTIESIAAGYRKSPAQLLIRWSIQHGLSVISKTTHESRLRENFDVFDFIISDTDMQILNSLNENYHAAGLSMLVGDDS